MDKLSRSVLRSILRWGRVNTMRREAQLGLDLSALVESHNIKLLTTTPSVTSMSELRNVVLDAYRANVNNEGNVDAALSLLRALNEKGAELDKCYQQRLINMSEDVLKHRIFKIGDVVVHQETNTRCVVVGWQVDEESGEQYLSLLVDQLDAHEYLRAGHPLLSQPSLESIEDDINNDEANVAFGGMIAEDGSMVVDIDDLSAGLENMEKQNIDSVQEMLKKRATPGGINSQEFVRVTDPALQRICNEARSPSLYFDGFDEISGRFIPGSDLVNMYPRDVLPIDHTRGLEELTLRLEQQRERMAVVGAVARVATVVAETLKEILSERGLGGDPQAVDSVRGHELKQLLIGQDIVGEVKGKVDELLEAAQQLEQLREAHAGSTSPALEKLVAYASLDDKAKEGQEAPSAVANCITDDDTVFRVVSLLTAVYQSADHMLELRFQDRGRGYYEREVAQRFPHYDPEAAEIANNSNSTAPDALEGASLGIKQTEPVTFRIGEVVRHRKFGYRGVVLGWDIRPLGDAKAIATRWEGVVGLPSGADQPFYRILPDEEDVEAFLGPGSFRSSFYVAEENLQLVPLPWEVESGNEIDVAASVRPVNTHAQRSDLDSALDDLAASRTIEHRFMSLYFSSYHTPTGRYISPHRRHFQFPDRDVESIGEVKRQDRRDTAASIEEQLEALRASHAAERERNEYHSPYNKGMNSADQGEQEQDDQSDDEDNDEDDQSRSADVDMVADRIEGIEASLKAQLAQHRRTAIHMVREHRLSSISDAERAEVEEMAAEEGRGQALAEDALFSMLGYLRSVFKECRVSSEGGLVAAVPAPHDPSSGQVEGTDRITLQLAHLASLLRTARKREDALAIESAIWICLSAHPDYRVSGELSKGTELTKSGYDEEALRAFKRAAMLDPTYSEPLNKISALHHRSGQPRRSLKYAQKVLALMPGHFGALAGISMAYEVAAKYEDSAQALRSTLSGHPWATRGPTVLAALQKKIDSQRNESVVEEVLAGLDADSSRRKGKKVQVPAPGVVRSTRKRGQKRESSSNRSGSGASARKEENGEGEK